MVATTQLLRGVNKPSFGIWTKYFIDYVVCIFFSPPPPPTVKSKLEQSCS